MNWIRRLYFKIFKRYRRIDFKLVTYAEGDKLIRQNAGKSESEQWVIAKEEDTNFAFMMVFLERRERIKD